MICSACGFSNPDFAKFCGRCGAAQASTTPPSSVPSTNTKTVTDSPHRTLLDLKRDIVAVVELLVAPTADSLKTINKSSSSQKRSARQFIRTELMNVMLYFARLDQPIPTAKSEVFLSLYGLLDSTFSRYTTDQGLSFLNEFMRNGPSQGVEQLQKSLCLTCIEQYDHSNGTGFSVEARNLYLDVAWLMAGAGGRVSPAARSEFERYAALLLSPESGKSVGIRAVATSTLDQGAIKSSKVATQSQPVSNYGPLVDIREELDRLSAELSHRLKDMLQNAGVLDVKGEPVRGTDPSRYIQMDVLYLLRLFSSLEGGVSANRAEVLDLFFDHQEASSDGERIRLIRAKFADMLCKDQQPIHQLATLDLLEQYDQLFETHHAKEAGLNLWQAC